MINKTDRNIEILKLYSNGFTKTSIAKRFGISITRVTHIVDYFERMKNKPPCWTTGLKTRTSNGLKCAGFLNKDDVLNCINTVGLKKLDNIGAKGISEIYDWLGIVSPDIANAITNAITLLEGKGYIVTKKNK